MNSFDPKTQNWQDVFGDGMTARQVLNAAVSAIGYGVTVNEEYMISIWLDMQYEDLSLTVNGYDPMRYSWDDFDAMAHQVMVEALD